MDTDALVENRIEEGRKLVTQLVGSGFDVSAACWVKTGEEGRWFLYVVSKAVDEKGATAAYRVAYGVLQSMDSPWISMSEVKLIGTTNAIARDLLETQWRHPGMTRIRTRRPQLGDMSVEEAYIYPPLPRPNPSWREVRLKTEVEQNLRPEEFVEPLTTREREVLGQIVSSGVVPVQAEYLIRKRRERERHKTPIPAGTVVKAWVTGWWGDSPEDDPNPLLKVEAPDGSQGLTFKENTEPVGGPVVEGAGSAIR